MAKFSVRRYWVNVYDLCFLTDWGKAVTFFSDSLQHDKNEADEEMITYQDDNVIYGHYMYSVHNLEWNYKMIISIISHWLININVNVGKVCQIRDKQNTLGLFYYWIIIPTTHYWFFFPKKQHIWKCVLRNYKFMHDYTNNIQTAGEYI